MPAAAAAKSLQSCPTLCDPRDSSPPGSPVPGILQARILEWVAISFSNAWKWKVKVKSLSCVQLLATPWTTAYQAPPSMGFSKQEYWSGVPLPSPIGKTINLTKWTFSGKVMSLLFNILFRFVIGFPPRSNHLLISWLQSQSTVILEPSNPVLNEKIFWMIFSSKKMCKWQADEKMLNSVYHCCCCC